MLSPKQEELIDNLEKAWAQHPEWRFGQLLSNICHRDDMIFYLDDDTLSAKLRPYLPKPG